MKDKKLNTVKSTGFKVPKDYFENFEDSLFEKMNTQKTIGVSQTGFEVPKDYFENIEDRILDNVKDKEETKVISLFNRKTVVYISSIAAAVLLLFNLSIFNSTVTVGDLETATVENYILEEDISSYDIASLFTEELPNEEGLVDFDLDEERLEEYLLNNADIENLMIE